MQGLFYSLQTKQLLELRSKKLAHYNVCGPRPLRRRFSALTEAIIIIAGWRSPHGGYAVLMAGFHSAHAIISIVRWAKGGDRWREMHLFYRYTWCKKFVSLQTLKQTIFEWKL
jgi:hypothetical protein